MSARRVASGSARAASRVTCLAAWAAAWVAGCTGKEPIRVGFAAQLTGVQAELGVQERNGVQLAVEELNAAGGVAGRRIELVVADDLGTPEGAQAADRGLLRAGVVAIIGHPTSGQTIAGLAVTEPAGVVMLSPTASSPALGGKKDHFFRVLQSTVAEARALARRVHQGRKLGRMALVHDRDNAAYATAFVDAFVAEYEALGGKVVDRADFSSKAQPDHGPWLAALRAKDPEGLLVVAADVDAAMIAQRTRVLGWPVPLFTAGWAQTATLIANGGRAVEGLEVALTATIGTRRSGYVAFAERYQARFGQVPSFGAVLGYEAAKVLAFALRSTGGRAAGLPEALTAVRDFEGVSETFSLDAYGDADQRPFHLATVRDGRFVSLEAAAPAGR